MPFSAWIIFCSRSKANGFVTTATVRIPASCARRATTGAAPVPVPPPMPAVINTMSTPFSAASISSLFSSALCWPTSGLFPAPRPFVSFAPIWILVVAFELFSAFASVFTAIYSISFTSEDAIQFNAFPPPPPTPITLIFTSGSNASS